MKNLPLITTSILSLLFSFFLDTHKAQAQCNNFGSQYPSFTQSITCGTSATISTCMFGGQYAVCAVTAGNTYTWNTCGDTDFDTQITLSTAIGGTVLGYNDDNCGLQSSVTWTATFTGNVYVLVSRYSCTSESTCMTLNWSCTGGGGGSPCTAINIPSAPVSNQALVCSGSNNLNSGNVSSYCGSPSTLYMGGNEALYTFTPSSSGTYTISYAGQTWSSIFVYQGCPTTGTCVNATGSSASSQSLNVTLNAGTTYYIWFDTWPSPASPCPGTFSITPAVAANTVPASGSNSYTLCSGNLYDNGGPAGNYGNGQNGYTVLYPATAGNMIQVSGTTSGEGCCDYLYIYNGVGTGGTLLWSGYAGIGTVPVITSTSGPLTVQFTSDVSVVGAGFNLAINCVAPPAYNYVPTVGSNSYTLCSGNLYDNGGPGGNYGNGQSGYTVLYPATAGSAIQVSGTTSGEGCCDYLYIYNGVGTGGTLLWSGYAGIGTVPVITSTSGPLTVQFTSDGSVVGAGFNLSISCVPLILPNTVPPSGNNSYTLCSGNLYDSGGPGGDYGNSQNGYTVLNPATAGNMVQVSGTTSGEGCCDYLYIYNGVGTGGTLLWSGVANSGTVPVITSTSGPLTVQFTSDGSVVGAGFNLAINCVIPAPSSISASQSAICSGSSSTLTANNPFGTVYWYSGTCGGTLIGTGNSISVSPTTTTTYFARNYNGSSFSSCVNTTITVLANPTLNAGANQNFCPGGSVMLNGTTSASTYYWTPTTGLSNPNILNPIASPASTTTYTLHATSSAIFGSQIYYIRGLVGEPWGYTNNITAMNTVFGAGNWTAGYFETISAASVFNSSTKFVFLEGSDNSALELNTFLASNLPAIESWVASGGVLYINAAPNEGGNINFGFGGTTLNYSSSSPMGYAAVAHPIFNGPYLPSGGSWPGNSFAHGYITGTGFTTLINNPSLTLLAEKNWGSGRVLFGGLTTAFDHPLTDYIQELNRNILHYCGNLNLASVTCTSTAQTTVTVNPLPNNFSPVVATSMPLCHGSNAEISINPSQTGISYQLYNGATPVGSAVNGNGGAISMHTNNLNANLPANQIHVVAGTALACTLDQFVPALINVSPPPITLANNGDSRTCYVNGNNAFVEFTMGTNGIAAINPGSQNLGYVTITEYVEPGPVNIQACNTNPTNQPQFTSAALNRHWLISSTIAPVSPSDIRLYINGSDVTALAAVANINANPNDDVSGLSSLELSKYTGPNENNLWPDNCNTGGVTTLHTASASGLADGAIVGGSGIVSGSYLRYSIPSFSELWLSGTNNVSPLPIVLGAFDLHCADKKTEIEWTTLSEINNAYFQIQRSINGIEWENIAEIPGSGNSNMPLQYSYSDASAPRGMVYYRLKQVDYNGAFEIFGVKSIACHQDAASRVLLYPNPTHDHFTIEFELDKNYSDGQIELIDMTGRVVGQKNLELTEGFNSYTYSPLPVSGGLYTVRIKAQGEVLLQSPIVIHKQ